MQLTQLALRLRACGHDLSVASMLKPVSFQNELERSGIGVYSLDMRRGIADLRTTLKLAALIRRLKPAIVHSHMVHANILARVTRVICRFPILICTAHNVHEVADGKPPKAYHLRDFLYRVTDRWADITTQICQAGADRYVGVRAVSPEKIRVIYNGTDIRHFRPDFAKRLLKREELGLKSEWVWLAVGRFHYQKDYPNLLRAFASCRQTQPDDRLIIAGDGPLRFEITEQCRQLGLASRVHFLGHRQDVRDLMQAADALVLASRFEGLPLALIEAQACGLPVVATATGGNAEIVDHGQTGMLCAAQNDRRLCEAMLHLRNMPPPMLEKMRIDGRAKACRQFDIDRIVEQWETLYSELARHTPPTNRIASA